MSETAHVHGGSCNHAGHDHQHADTAKTARDPVCGMSVNPETSKHRFEHNGTTYHFCCNGCRTKFEADPEKYLNEKAEAKEVPAPAGTIYTCPMHPEIHQVGPGSCPICGMALEPEQISLDDKPDPELIDMTRRFWIALALTVPVFVLEMGGDLGLRIVPPVWSNWISLVLATPVVLWAGAPFFERGWKALLTRNLHMFTLFAIGVGVG